MILQGKKYLLFLSFLEGGAVMACELIGAKLLAPFFGTSLYIWAAALALTLGGLTLGYFFGGRLSRKYDGSKPLLYWILIIAGFLLVLMPFSSELIMEQTIQMTLETGAILSLLVFMVPPLMFMGMVSPVIINLLTQSANSAGNNAGNVYAISTTGGILTTFLMGFYVIPHFGLIEPAVISGILLALLPTVSLLLSKRKGALVGLLMIRATAVVSLSTHPNFNEEYQVRYQSEGILGQIKVVDHPSYAITKDSRMGRGLIVNNTLQTYVGLADSMEYSIWSWANFFPTAASVFPPGSDVLLLGLGGGTLVKQLNRLEFNTDVVEIDHRVRDVSFEYFNLSRSTNVVIDDARHFIRTTNQEYDIVIFDTFLSESVPEHLITLEGFADVKEILRPGGMIMINFYGFLKGERGRAARSVYRTLKESGLNVEVLPTSSRESTRNLIFLASEAQIDFSKTRYFESNFKSIDDLYTLFLSRRDLQSDDALVLTDHKPRLTKLYTKAAREWRKSYNAYYQKYFSR